MMLLKKKNIIGLVLCTLILSASIPMLLGIQNAPKSMFGGDMVAISQVNSSVNLNVSLLDIIKEEPNVISASAEITCFCVVNDYPVLVRGVILDDFLELNGGQIKDGVVKDKDRFAIVGKKLAGKVNLDVGDRFVLTGSSNPSVYQLEVDGIFHGRDAEDEILVPLHYARKMAGLGRDAVLIIRVQTTNHTALVETLQDNEQPAVVTTSGDPVAPINAEITEEQKAQQQLAIKYLDAQQFKALNGTYVSTFIREGSSSVSVVVTTFIILDGALAFIGSAAIVSRAIIERRRELGIISAVGADRSYLRKLILKDLFLMSVIASFLGLAMGYLLVMFIEEYSLLQMFGESIYAVITPQIAIGIFLASVFIHMLSALAIERMLSGVKPRELLQETEKAEREADATPLSSILGADA